MPELRARSLPAEGPAAVFDPAAPEAFIARAGRQFVGIRGGAAVVRTQGGDEVTVYPGWVVIGGGDGEATFHTPERVEITAA
jgi:hypothetical protein